MIGDNNNNNQVRGKRTKTRKRRKRERVRGRSGGESLSVMEYVLDLLSSASLRFDSTLLTSSSIAYSYVCV